MSKEVVLTGLRSNDEFHLGNYLGAILPMVELQKKHAGEYQLHMFIPDLHSFTTPIDHSKLFAQTIDNLKVFVAAGLDINNPNTLIYRQSYIPAHSEMTWILNCFSYFGELSRMTEFKDKSSKSDSENISAGLFTYPVLMAADILLYDAKWIPVGDDQRQHLEFTRNLAIRMNNKFGKLFVVPEDSPKQQKFSNRTESVRIRSLRNPDKKMSKSIEDPAGTILLSDTPEAASKKVMEATTDSVGVVHYDWEKQPGITNLMQILDLLNNSAGIAKKWEGKTSYGDLKTEVASAVNDFMRGLQSKLAQIDEAKLIKKLEKDEETMSQLASAKLLKVQQAVGLRPKAIKH
ncbi:MAG: tryptophan--tRNA ligase [Candidatus Saccharimonadales bacterium]